MSSGDSVDPVVLQSREEDIQLLEINNIIPESTVFHEMVVTSGADPHKRIEKTSMSLKQCKDFVQPEYPDASSQSKGTCPLQGYNDQKSVNIPDDFRCPISLELMRDPVIVSTGQTYERQCIKKWLDMGHGTCPKTQQTLSSTTLTPNYALRSLISNWCEANRVDPPKPLNDPHIETDGASARAEHGKVESLILKLMSGRPDCERSAAGEVRLLAKRNAENRVAIARAGAVPLLVNLLSAADRCTQEHAVTALLNLSICDTNKAEIVSSGAVPPIVGVLRRGTMEARENAAAALFSLSVVDENKVVIGNSGAIPPLVALLGEGTRRGKKDAATALFNLCIYQGNKGKAVRAGLVPTLRRLLTESGGCMVDEALAITAVLASHHDGRAAIGSMEIVPVLVEVIRNGSPRNRENAAAILVHLSSSSSGQQQHHLMEARCLGVEDGLVELSQNGTERGKRKAVQMLERMSRLSMEPEKAVEVKRENTVQS